LTFLSAVDIFVCRWHFCLSLTFCNLWTSLWLECCLNHFYEWFRKTNLISALRWAFLSAVDIFVCSWHFCLRLTFLSAVDIFVCRWHFVTYELPWDWNVA
jgi:hypothetical protein